MEGRDASCDWLVRVRYQCGFTSFGDVMDANNCVGLIPSIMSIREHDFGQCMNLPNWSIISWEIVWNYIGLDYIDGID